MIGWVVYAKHDWCQWDDNWCFSHFINGFLLCSPFFFLQRWKLSSEFRVVEERAKQIEKLVLSVDQRRVQESSRRGQGLRKESVEPCEVIHRTEL